VLGVLAQHIAVPLRGLDGVSRLFVRASKVVGNDSLEHVGLLAVLVAHALDGLLEHALGSLDLALDGVQRGKVGRQADGSIVDGLGLGLVVRALRLALGLDRDGGLVRRDGLLDALLLPQLGELDKRVRVERDPAELDPVLLRLGGRVLRLHL